MKIVKLDKNDIRHLVSLMLEADENVTPPPQANKKGTPGDELADTKSEILRQAKANISQMVYNKELGTIISIFVILMTDKASEQALRTLGHHLEDHLAKGGKEVDFTTAVSRVLKPLAGRFIKALSDSIGAEGEDQLNLNEQYNGPSYEEQTQDLEDYQNELKSFEEQLKANPDLQHDANFVKKYNSTKDAIHEIQQNLNKMGEGENTTKGKLRKVALERINKMSSNPDIIRVFSMVLLYLTDKDTVNALKPYGKTYGATLTRLMNNNKPEWTQNKITELRNKFNPLINKMADFVAKELSKVKTGEAKPADLKNKFEQDKQAVQDIINRYNLK